MIRSNHFSTGDRIRAQRVLSVMEDIAKKDAFFADAVRDFDERNDWQIEYLLEIYWDWCEGRDWMSLETAVRLCAYE